MVYDLIIVGGGPAGITAGIYAARQRLSALLITKDFGGQITRKSVYIENYPGFEKISGKDLIERLKHHLEAQKIETVMASVVNIEKGDNLFNVKTDNKKDFQSKTVVIASGADPRPLEVPGEKEFIGKGVSYCTLCDAPVFQGKDVAVIGGGDAGFEAAIALSHWASKVYIVEFMDKVAASPENQKIATEDPKIEIITSAAVQKINGNQFVNSLEYKNRKTAEIKTLAVEGVFVQIGSQPATSFVKDLVDFNDKDEIISDPKTAQTRTPGLFTAGDVDNVPYKQIIIACGEGAKAALSAYYYIKKQG